MARYSKACRSPSCPSISRVYADINDKRPPEYWDYESLNIQVGSLVQHSSSRPLQGTLRA